MFKKIATRVSAMLLAFAMVTLGAGGAFAAEPEAQIGDTTYAYLWQALEAVQDGQTIEVLKDISNEELTFSSDCSGPRSVVIDLNDHTISESTNNSPAFTYISHSGNVAPKLEIRDGKLNCTSKTNNSPYASGIWVESMDGKCKPILIVKHVAITSKNDAGINCIDAQLQVGSANINAHDDAIYAQNAKVYIQAGSFVTASGTDIGKDGALAANNSTISITANDGIVTPSDWQTKKSAQVRVTWFEDVPSSSWYYEPVYSLAKRNIVSGKNCWTFGSYDDITRAEAVTLLGKASGQDVSSYYGNTEFGDVSRDAWYNHYVGWAVEKGIVSGYGYHQFGPEDPVTREQLAVMLFKYQSNIMKKAPVDKVTPPEYADADQVSEWAKEPLDTICREGIISGVGQDDGTVLLQPQECASRAQMSVMLYKILAL